MDWPLSFFSASVTVWKPKWVVSPLPPVAAKEEEEPRSVLVSEAAVEGGKCSFRSTAEEAEHGVAVELRRLFRARWRRTSLPLGRAMTTVYFLITISSNILFLNRRSYFYVWISMNIIAFSCQQSMLCVCWFLIIYFFPGRCRFARRSKPDEKSNLFR